MFWLVYFIALWWRGNLQKVEDMMQSYICLEETWMLTHSNQPFFPQNSIIQDCILEGGCGKN